MNKDDSDWFPVAITVEQALTRLLELIRTSKTSYDFTPARLGKVMQVPIAPGEGGRNGYGQGGLVTPQWNLGFGVDLDWAGTFELSLNPRPIGTSPSLTGLCQMDFDRFTAELEAMGFTRPHPYRSPPQPPPGEESLPHGGLMYDYFDGPGMGIHVYPQGESDENPGHLCVEKVMIYGRRLE